MKRRPAEAMTKHSEVSEDRRRGDVKTLFLSQALRLHFSAKKMKILLAIDCVER